MCQIAKNVGVAYEEGRGGFTDDNNDKWWESAYGRGAIPQTLL